MTDAAFEMKPGEEEIIAGYANKVGLLGSVGGKLVLTNQRLLFTNRRQSQIKAEIPLSAILHIAVASSASLVTVLMPIAIFLKNAVRVTLKGGDSQRFVVNNKTRWVDLIDEYRQKIQKA